MPNYSFNTPSQLPCYSLYIVPHDVAPLKKKLFCILVAESTVPQAKWFVFTSLFELHTLPGINTLISSYIELQLCF